MSNQKSWLSSALSGTKKRTRPTSKITESIFWTPQIFENPTIEAIDDRGDYGELRCIALGLSGETVLHVVYTWRGESIIRIISARKATRHDAEKYYREIFA